MSPTLIVSNGENGWKDYIIKIPLRGINVRDTFNFNVLQSVFQSVFEEFKTHLPLCITYTTDFNIEFYMDFKTSEMIMELSTIKATDDEEKTVVLKHFKY